jgi:hypothetical protein
MPGAALSGCGWERTQKGAMLSISGASTSQVHPLRQWPTANPNPIPIVSVNHGGVVDAGAGARLAIGGIFGMGQVVLVGEWATALSEGSGPPRNFSLVGAVVFEGVLPPRSVEPSFNVCAGLQPAHCGWFVRARVRRIDW